MSEMSDGSELLIIEITQIIKPQVWSMILAAATEGGGSQYFYLAPKMPYGLEYKPGTVR